MINWHRYASHTHLECHLSCEDEFVLLKQSSRGVDEHRERDAIDQIVNSGFHFFSWFSFVNGFLEHHIKGLQRTKQKIAAESF